MAVMLSVGISEGQSQGETNSAQQESFRDRRQGCRPGPGKAGRSEPRNPAWWVALRSRESEGHRKGAREATLATALSRRRSRRCNPSPVTAAAGSFLLLGCNNGSIYYVGEQRPAPQLSESLPSEVGEEGRLGYLEPTPLILRAPAHPTAPRCAGVPLRMKDNDLLVSELYRDPAEGPVTALSVHLTPKTSKLWLSLAPLPGAASPQPQPMAVSPPLDTCVPMGQ